MTALSMVSYKTEHVYSRVLVSPTVVHNTVGTVGYWRSEQDFCSTQEKQ